MPTPIEAVTDDSLRRAARIINDGGLAAFPTETVYGLGANAFNPTAVKRLYAVKGRPPDNPLILHINTREEAAELAVVTDAAEALMDAFWPGPLTLVLKKNVKFPRWVGSHPSGVTETVALRAPMHKAAQLLIRYAGCAIAAPSANKSGTPSPTSASHVFQDFNGAIDIILDGGPAAVGLESTVADMTGPYPAILRPGAVTAEMIQVIIGVNPDLALTQAGGPLRSPGIKYRHYAPLAPLTVVTSKIKMAETLAKYAEDDMQAGKHTRRVVLATAQTAVWYAARFNTKTVVDPGDGDISGDVIILTMGDRDAPETIANTLYACLRRCDELNAEAVFAEAIPETGLGRAIMNRMLKAAGGQII